MAMLFKLAWYTCYFAKRKYSLFSLQELWRTLAEISTLSDVLSNRLSILDFLSISFFVKIQGMSALLSGDDCGDQVQAWIFFGLFEGIWKEFGF